ncbi:ArnT family glycosyltransferase [Yersinia sp. 2541 StPb PI]|uniref:ArnT family glycosyltransferase n=1 Tax=Yersinia sp. 2541 StPb PI TaxID=3117407 RepID=UPI003FA4A3EF
MSISNWINRNKVNITVAMLFALSFFLLIRNSGLYPIVFADEYSYSHASRNLPFGLSALPNHLFFLVYSFTSVCGDGFLGCARILNVLFFIAASPFIYLSGKIYIGKGLSLLFMLIVMFGQFNTYTAYFMPESMYFLGFWLSVYITLLSINSFDKKGLFITAFAWGILSLIKPHALFVIPAVVVCYFFCGNAIKNYGVIKKGFIILSIPAIALFVKFLIGYLISGINGVSLFGTFYSPYADSAVVGGLSHYIEMAKFTINSLKGNLLPIAVLYSIPVLNILYFLINLVSKNKYYTEDNKNKELYIFSIFVVFSLVVVTALFTASISKIEPANHLHVRYYAFALPLLMLIAFKSSINSYSSGFSKLRLVFSILLSIAIIYSLRKGFNPYEFHNSTAPELFGIVNSGVMFKFILYILLFNVFVWPFSVRKASRLYAFLILPLIACVVIYETNKEIISHVESDVYDRSALFVNSYLDKKEKEDLSIVGTDSHMGGLYRTLFHIDMRASGNGIYGIPESQPFSVKDLTKNEKWILLIGDHKMDGDVVSSIKADGYELIQVRE